MRYSCGCKANLGIVTREQVRAAKWCPFHSPEGQAAYRSREREQARESERRNMLTQASLDAVGMGHLGPLTEDRR